MLVGEAAALNSKVQLIMFYAIKTIANLLSNVCILRGNALMKVTTTAAVVIAIMFWSNLLAAPVPHSHNGRPHAHPLPVLKAHEHNGVWMDKSHKKPLNPTAAPKSTSEDALLKKRCNEGSEDACNHLWFVKRCDNGNGQYYACVGAASNYQNGRTVSRDYSKAIFFHKASCRSFSTHCHDLGLLYEEGKITAKSFAKAAEYFKKACDGKELYANGCYKLALYYEEGKGVKQNSSKAMSLHKRACDHKPSACYELANFYAEGRSVKQDLAEAIFLYGKSCEGGRFLKGCKKGIELQEKQTLKFYGITREPGQNPEQDLKDMGQVARKDCSRGDEDACYLLEVVNRALELMAKD